MMSVYPILNQYVETYKRTVIYSNYEIIRIPKL